MFEQFDLGNLDWAWLAAPAIAALAGLALLWRGLKSLRRGRVMSGGRGVVAGATAIGAACLAALVALNIQTYSRLTWEEPVADVSVATVDEGDKQFDVVVTRADGTGEVSCRLQGDEWIMGGRVQTWKPWARTLGLDATFELDQIANKYRDAREGNGKIITACDLSRSPNAVLARLPEGFRAWLSTISIAEDRDFGSANYMPLADGAHYRVVITQTGFNSEPVNDSARDAMHVLEAPTDTADAGEAM